MTDPTVHRWDRIWGWYLAIAGLVFAALEAIGLSGDRRKTLTHWVRRRIPKSRVARWGFAGGFVLFFGWLLLHFLGVEGF